MEAFLASLRFGLRTLGRSPLFTLATVLSLALGIGANTAIFTFVNAALLKPLPYPNSKRIVALSERPPQSPTATRVHPRSFIPWRERAQSFEALAIAQPIPVNTQGIDGAEQVAGLWATPELFRVFGVAPALGRLFTEQDGFNRAAVRGEGPGGSVVVLSHGYWQRRFASDPNVLGRTIPIQQSTSVVIGVMPPGFRVGALDADVFVPLPIDRNKPEAVGSRAFHCFGLLKPEATVASAQAEMAVIGERVSREQPMNRGWTVEVVSLRDFLVRDNRLVLLLLMGAVACVLLIACANVAGLSLTRGLGRRGELALRASLGASRSRLVLPSLAESLILSVAGGVLGLLLGWWASRGLALLAKDAVAFGQMSEVSLDPRVFLFTLGLSLLTALVSGLIPAWQTSQFDLQGALKAQSRAGSDTRGQQRLRAVLVVGEVALAVVLLVGSGLLLRTFAELLQAKLGFQPDQVLTMRMLVTGDAARRSSFVERVLDAVKTLPEVRAVGTIQFLPLGGFTNNCACRLPDRAEPADGAKIESDVSTVSRGYFAAMGIPLLRGRVFERRDQMDSPRVALVNQAFVQRYSLDKDLMGEHIIGDWSNAKPTEIVGVVGDIRQHGLNTEPRPTVFLAQPQHPGYITYVVVRSAGDSRRLTAAVRREIQQIEPSQPVTDVRTMAQYISASLSRPRLYAAVTGMFAWLALLLSAGGLYGLMAYAVSRRTREIGIRMALGAEPRRVVRAMLGQGVRLAAAGLGLGLPGAVVLGRFLTAFLYGIKAIDPVTYVLVPALLAVVALLAASVPARRAARIDPAVALRSE
jgi:putative ABC transport system permease protein